MTQKVRKTAEFPHVALIDRILDVHVVVDKFSPAEQCRRGGCPGPVHREDCGVVVSEQWDVPQTLFFNSVMVIPIFYSRERAL